MQPKTHRSNEIQQSSAAHPTARRPHVQQALLNAINHHETKIQEALKLVERYRDEYSDMLRAIQTEAGGPDACKGKRFPLPDGRLVSFAQRNGRVFLRGLTNNIVEY